MRLDVFGGNFLEVEEPRLLTVRDAVYCIVHRPTRRAYIGQTSYTVAQRWLQHQKRARLGGKSKFACAIRKHGHAEFDVYVVSSGLSKRERDLLEIGLIDSLRTCESGFNISRGGDSNPMENAESREKVAASKRGKVYSRDFGLAVSSGKKGKPLSSQHKQAISDGLYRAFSDPDVLLKMSLARLGRKHSDETKRKIGLAHTGMKRTAETCAAISAAKRAVNARRKLENLPPIDGGDILTKGNANEAAAQTAG